MKIWANQYNFEKAADQNLGQCAASLDGLN